MSAPTSTWNDFVQHFFHDETLGISLDTSRMQAPVDLATRMEGPLREALQAMQDLEGGAIANPDEKRMVGHYWLRCPELAPSGELRRTIEQTNERVRDFVNQVHMAEVRGERDEAFTNFLLIGIGGSALGPQLVADALGTGGDQLVPHFMDNTDPDGIARTLDRLQGLLDRTLVVVISKSGGTPETRNGMLETQAAYARAGLKFARHAVAVTSDGSGLDKRAIDEQWLARFPMWDWVGGRTSVTSAVGLLPAALQGVDIEALLQGAAAMDELTRKPTLADNPALLLALMWHYAGDGKGKKDMVILPYKDRLLLLSKYLQQLIMESLGKEKDTRGNVVNQGIAVYGNKGSTDQHAYVQQLREGLNNFFATFIEVLQDDAGSGTDELAEVEPGVFSGDYLQGFFLGTRTALADMGRGSITITIRRLDARSLGMLIALFERAVGFYATLVGINAYHQPGVEAGKKAAAEVLGLQQRLLATMGESTGASRTALSWAEIVGAPAQAETIFKLLERLAANPGRGVIRVAGKSPAEHTYRRV